MKVSCNDGGIVLPINGSVYVWKFCEPSHKRDRLLHNGNKGLLHCYYVSVFWTYDTLRHSNSATDRNGIQSSVWAFGVPLVGMVMCAQAVEDDEVGPLRCCMLARKTSTMSNSTNMMPSLWIQQASALRTKLLVGVVSLSIFRGNFVLAKVTRKQVTFLPSRVMKVWPSLNAT